MGWRGQGISPVGCRRERAGQGLRGLQPKAGVSTSHWEGEESAKQIWGCGTVSGVLVLLLGGGSTPTAGWRLRTSPPNTRFPPSVDPNDQKKTACYDIDVEVDDPLKAQMSNFLASTTNQQEIASLDAKVRGLSGGSARVAVGRRFKAAP